MRGCPKPVPLQSHCRHSYSPNSRISHGWLVIFGALWLSALAVILWSVQLINEQHPSNASWHLADALLITQWTLFVVPKLSEFVTRGGQGTRRRPTRALHAASATVNWRQWHSSPCLQLGSQGLWRATLWGFWDRDREMFFLASCGP